MQPNFSSSLMIWLVFAIFNSSSIKSKDFSTSKSPTLFISVSFTSETSFNSIIPLPADLSIAQTNKHDTVPLKTPDGSSAGRDHLIFFARSIIFRVANIRIGTAAMRKTQLQYCAFVTPTCTSRSFPETLHSGAELSTVFMLSR